MTAIIKEPLLEYKVSLHANGHYVAIITTYKGKLIETDLGLDEDIAKSKLATLVNGLAEGVEAIIDGMLSAYGEAEDSVEE